MLKTRGPWANGALTELNTSLRRINRNALDIESSKGIILKKTILHFTPNLAKIGQLVEDNNLKMFISLRRGTCKQHSERSGKQNGQFICLLPIIFMIIFEGTSLVKFVTSRFLLHMLFIFLIQIS